MEKGENILDNINQLMYQLSHLQLNSHLNWLLISLAIVFCIVAFVIVILMYAVDNDKYPWRTWLSSGVLILFVFLFFYGNDFSNPFKYQTVSPASITKLNQVKSDTSKEYPYTITLQMYDSAKSYPDVYVLLFKNFNVAKNTSTYLNSAINSKDDSGKTIFLHPDKDTTILECTTKKVGNNKQLQSLLNIKDYQQLTETKTVNMSRASYHLTPTDKMSFTWIDDSL